MSVLYKHNDEVERVAGSYRPIIYSPRPDWANAIPITAAQVVAGYTAPSDGMITGYGLARSGSSVLFSVNNVTVSKSAQVNGSYVAFSNTQVPVSKGDIFKSDHALDGVIFSFVPWKE